MNHHPEESKAQIWQKHMEDWKLSGLSQQSYCEQQGIRYTTFGYWRNALNKRTKTTLTSFVELKPPSLTPSMNLAIQFILPNGVKIGVPVQAGHELIIQVLTEISNLRC